jgi:methanogenic corrinoid protein MtbC1
MILSSMVGRSRLAQKLADTKEYSSQAVSDELFLKHPEWLDRYGERGRQICRDDISFHIQFLAGAIEAGSPEAFADYALWTRRMLGARGLADDSLRETFDRLADQLALVLSIEESSLASSFLKWDGEETAASISTPEGTGFNDGLRLTREVFLSAILSGQRRLAANVIEEALREGHPLVDIYVDVIAQALHRIGKLWESNKITIAQEHLATAITQHVIASVYPKITSTGPRLGHMTVTGVAGEFHQIGANLVADAMETQGWDVSFLGSNVPSVAIVEAVQQNSSDVLCISTTLIANLRTVAELIRLVRARLGNNAPRIVVGGAAFRLTPNFADDMGVISCAPDFRTTLAMFCS